MKAYTWSQFPSRQGRANGALRHQPSRPQVRLASCRNERGSLYHCSNRPYENLTCDLCDATASGETFEEWMKALFPHYQEAHPDVMNDPSKTRDDRERWMKENMARFEAAPDDV